MENHHFSWVNSLYMAIFNSKTVSFLSTFTRGYHLHKNGQSAHHLRRAREAGSGFRKDFAGIMRINLLYIYI